MAIYLFAMMVIDFLQGRRRDWLHWLGAFLPIGVALINVFVELAARLGGS